MTKLSLSLIFCFFSLICFSQIWEDQLLTKNYNPSIAEKVKAFETYRASIPYTKGNGYKPYARNMDFVQQRVNNNSFPSAKLYLEWEKEVEKYKYSKISSSSNWEALGPIDVPIMLSNGKRRGNGRVNCIAFDPVDPDIIWIGAPAGGLWKTIDGGSNWSTTTDNLPVIGVSSITIDPNNTQIIYIATGDANASDTYSVGIMKSIDGGSTWNTTGLSYTASQGKIINKVIINPNYSDSLFAVTNSNIMLSIDEGTNWVNVGPNGRWRDIEFKPGNPAVMYAAKQSSGGSNIYRSTDGGAQWSVISNGVSSTGKYRPLIAVTPDNPEVIYALFSASDYSFHGLYKSSDAGDNWALQSNSPNILGRDPDGTSTGGQSWYDLSLGVATDNENLVYVGGIGLWRSDDSGINWDIDAYSGDDQQLYSYMHVDQHALEFNPINHIAYAGNDGGFYKYMDNLNKWVDISDGLEISQFYRLGLSGSNPNRLVAGAQDNGTEMLTNGTWDAIRSADGMECAIDPFDADIIYSTSQYGGLKKTYDGGNNWNNIKPVSYEGGWVTPYKIHPQNNDLIVVGYDEVYRSTDGGASWDSISDNVSNGQSIRIIALASSDEDYIYAATYTKFMMTKDGGANWTPITNLPNINISDITVDANNADKLWVTFSGYSGNNKVYQSVDSGDNWVNISGTNLPNLPVNCIVYQDYANEDLYIGTDVGVYYKDNTMTEWMPFMNGLPNVIVSELEIHYGAGKLRAATFGRGIWESDLNTLSSPVVNQNTPSFSIYPNPAKNEITINYNYFTSQSIHVNVFNITGQKVITNTINSIDNKINTSVLNNGCYIVEFIANNGLTTRNKLIIK